MVGHKEGIDESLVGFHLGFEGSRLPAVDLGSVHFALCRL